MKNLNFPWIQEIKPPVNVDSGVLDACNSQTDALKVTWSLRRTKFSQAFAAGELGIPTSHLSNILQGKKYLPIDLRVPFMWLCGNLAMRQYEDLEMQSIGLNAELAEAEKRVAELKARKAA